MTEHCGIRRLWIPITALVAAAIAWFLPLYVVSDNLDAQTFTLACSSFVLLCGLVVAAWLLFGSGLRPGVRYGLFALLVGLPLALVRGVAFDGFMRPRLVPRWEPVASQVVTADRGSQSQAAGQPIGEPTAEDYPEFRNVRRDGVITGLTLARDWTANPPKPLWRQPAGEGYSGFSVVGSAAVTMEQRNANEAVVCYDANTGHQRWVYEYEAAFSDPVGGPGPRATPTIAGGDVYTFGATGVLLRLDGTTGQLKWRYDACSAEAPNIEWAMAGSPLVVDNLVIVNPGAQTPAAAGRAVVALDRDTGKPVWQSGSRKAGYASPMLATLCGVRQVLTFDATAAAGYDPATGKELWNVPFVHPNDPGINVAQPLVLGDDRLFLTAGYSMGGVALRLTKSGDGFAVEELWRTSQMRCKFASPVLAGSYIYGIDDGILACIDATTGKRKWKDGRYGHGQLLLAGDLLIVGAEGGRLALVEASPKACKEVAAIRALEGPKVWNHLTVARGRAYLRSHTEMVCYELPTE